MLSGEIALKITIIIIILGVWLECLFQDTEVDGSSPGISMSCP